MQEITSCVASLLVPFRRPCCRLSRPSRVTPAPQGVTWQCTTWHQSLAVWACAVQQVEGAACRAWASQPAALAPACMRTPAQVVGSSSGRPHHARCWPLLVLAWRLSTACLLQGRPGHKQQLQHDRPQHNSKVNSTGTSLWGSLEGLTAMMQTVAMKRAAAMLRTPHSNSRRSNSSASGRRGAQLHLALSQTTTLGRVWQWRLTARTQPLAMRDLLLPATTLVLQGGRLCRAQHKYEQQQWHASTSGVS